MKIKTADLIGPALNYAVAKADGNDEGWLQRQLSNPNPATRAIGDYSTDWAQGGPIIEWEGINLEYRTDSGTWDAWTPAPEQLKESAFCAGLTPLIAAMRCYVASKLGDEIDIPEELR